MKNKPLDRTLSPQDAKTLALSALGGALEFYDFIIFVYFTATISLLFFPPDTPSWLAQVQTYGIFAAGYLARPLGGIIMAHFGDTVGRKKIFSLSIFMMAVPTLLMGLLPTYAQIGLLAPILLLILRILQGAAIGGEVPGGWVFVSEHVPKKHVGLACGILTCGLTFGILLGSQVALWVAQQFSPEDGLAYGWRIAFILGGIFGLCAVLLRRHLQETPVFESIKSQKNLAKSLPVKAVLTQYPLQMVVSMVLTWLLSAGIVVVILMTPNFLQKLYGIARTDALAANSVATLCLTVGCIFYGWLADRIGAGKTLAAGSLVLIGAVNLFYGNLPQNLMPHYAAAGFAVGVVGAIPSLLVTAFPARIRFSGLSFSYNVSYAIFGGLTPVFVQYLMGQNYLSAPALYVSVLAGLGVFIGLIYWQHNTAIAMDQA
jgi:MFS family permease